MTIQRIILINVDKNCTVATSCKVIQISTFFFVFDYQTFKFVDLPCFDLIMLVFFYSIDEMNAHADFTFSYHVSKLRIIHVPAVFVHV